MVEINDKKQHLTLVYSSFQKHNFCLFSYISSFVYFYKVCYTSILFNQQQNMWE